MNCVTDETGFLAFSEGVTSFKCVYWIILTEP